MEFVLFFLALAVIAALQGEVSKLKKRVDVLESGGAGTGDGQ